jgi:5-bromo-4-chloroindolyl phosphate hydrolysis protein
MYYDLLEFYVNGSFFSKIDKAIELAEKFIERYSEHYRTDWTERDWEETLENFIILNQSN